MEIEESNYIESIPAEIIGLVTSHLDSVTLISTMFVCKKLMNIIKQFSNKFIRKKEYIKEAALHGYLNIIIWAKLNGCYWDSWTCANAAKGGHLKVLKWARSNGCDWNYWTCACAAEG